MPMTPYAGKTDVADLLGRELTTSELRMVDPLLLQASYKIAAVTTVADPDVSKGVAAAMVSRVLRNPDGRQQLRIDDLSFSLSPSVASGVLQLLDEERSTLLQSVPASSGAAAGASGAFTIRRPAAPWIGPTSYGRPL